MKKFFKYMGICILLSISFFYTEKTATVVKNFDDIMIRIKENAKDYYEKPIEAIISNNTIIPGKNGKEIDINNSYKEMHYIGNYNDKYLKYKKVYVKDKLINNMDKYIISGNKNIPNISLVFIVNDNDEIRKIINILGKNRIKANIFISGNWLEKNSDMINEISKNNVIGSIGYNYSYNDSSYPWLDNIIKRNTNYKHSFCIRTKDDINICKRNNNYTIDPNIIKNNAFVNTKKKLKNGVILAYTINKSLEEELELIIKYIISKGYNIVDLNQLLKE